MQHMHDDYDHRLKRKRLITVTAHNQKGIKKIKACHMIAYPSIMVL